MNNQDNNQDKDRQAEQARHSPGPWKLVRPRRDDAPVECGGVKWLSSERVVTDAEGVRVAELHCWQYEKPDVLHWYPDDKQMMLANARLVQLAPELLASLQECMEALREAGLDTPRQINAYNHARRLVNEANKAD